MMNTATQIPLRRELPTSPAWPTLSTRYDARLFSFFRDKVRPEDCADLTRRVWLDFLPRARVGLFAIARDVLLDYCKDRGPEPWKSTDRLHLALSRLPMDTRILLELRYFDRMSSRELSVLYGRPIEVLRQMLRDARRELEAQLAVVGEAARGESECGQAATIASRSFPVPETPL